MGFLGVSSGQFCWSDSTLTWQGGDKRKRRRQEGWGGGVRLFKGGDYFKYFRLKEAINRDTAIIRGNTTFMIIITSFFQNGIQGRKSSFSNSLYPGQRFRLQPYSVRL